MDILTREQAEQAVAAIDGWSFIPAAERQASGHGDSDVIHRRYTFESFRAAIDFIVAVADRAEAADHHPDLTNTYDTVGVTLSTHSAGGVTDKDIDLARQIAGAAAE